MTRKTTKPAPVPSAMSKLPPETTPSPLPTLQQIIDEKTSSDAQDPNLSRLTSPPAAFPKPKVRLECRSLDHEGANVFFSNTNTAAILPSAVSTVLSMLYVPSQTNAHIPSTRSVTLVLRPMKGVAYTTGIELDEDHKEIHFSLDYIQGISSRNSGRVTDEINGVLVHEMVHCWQWNGQGAAPGGLIEGIADYVRLRARLSPPHWKREPGGVWDAGYQHTGYFLDWLDETQGCGSVRKINNALQEEQYEPSLWQRLFGKSVEALWSEYQDKLRESLT